jgi:exodeoxyribonuclease VII small subunit
MSQIPDDIKAMSFEAALAELESIVQQLERGEVELEKSIAIYERGAALRAHCEARLKDAQLKVDRIVLGPDGQARTEPADLDG